MKLCPTTDVTLFSILLLQHSLYLTSSNTRFTALVNTEPWYRTIPVLEDVSNNDALISVHSYQSLRTTPNKALNNIICVKKSL